jgi:REP element-mobilizing transposase RayT
MIVKGEPAAYHIISRSALEGYALEKQDKDFLLSTIIWLSKIYFVEVFGFCIMGNHFHLMVKMHIGDEFSDKDIQARYSFMRRGKTKILLSKEQIKKCRDKWSNLSAYVQEIKQRFSQYFNKTHKRKGYFWADRFKSVIIDNGETLINCLAYIDLNPVRAGLVEKPEHYRWCSLGYYVETKDKESFLSLDFGLKEFGFKQERERFRYYLKYVHQKGGLINTNGMNMGVAMSTERFRHRTRYFSDSGIMGKKEFVEKIYGGFKEYFSSRYEKKPRAIRGLDGVFSLKRLSEK